MGQGGQGGGTVVGYIGSDKQLNTQWDYGHYIMYFNRPINHWISVICLIDIKKENKIAVH